MKGRLSKKNVRKNTKREPKKKTMKKTKRQAKRITTKKTKRQTKRKTTKMRKNVQRGGYKWWKGLIVPSKGSNDWELVLDGENFSKGIMEKLLGPVKEDYSINEDYESEATKNFKEHIANIEVAKAYKRGDWALWLINSRPDLYEYLNTPEGRKEAKEYYLSEIIDAYYKKMKK